MYFTVYFQNETKIGKVLHKKHKKYSTLGIYLSLLLRVWNETYFLEMVHSGKQNYAGMYPKTLKFPVQNYFIRVNNACI